MGKIWTILKFAKPYKSRVLLSILCHFSMVVFSLGSVTILIPILKIIFKNTKEVFTQPVYQGLGNIKTYLEGSLNYWISTYSESIGKQQVLFWVLLIAASFFILKNVFRYIGATLLVYIRNGVERDIRNEIHNKMVSLPISFFSEKRKGDIASRLTTDILEIQWALLSSIKRLVEDPLMIIGTLLLMFTLSPRLTLFVLILIPITGFIITTISRLLKKPSEQAKEEMGRLMSLVEEHIGGMPIIKSYGAEQEVHNTFQDSNHRHFGFMNKMLYRRDLSSPISEIMGSTVILIIIWFGAQLILESNELEPEVFITYVALFYQIINPAKSLSVAFYDIRRSEASIDRINTILDAENPILEKQGQRLEAKFDKALKFENVSFSYGEKPIIQHLNIEIKKGEMIALVGPSGGGKSTLAYLVNRFYDPTEGSILLDGVDYKELDLKSLRSKVGYISQDPILFYGTIRENLMFGNPDSTQDEVIEAAKVANAHDFIEQLENGYETQIGDRGLKLSGGQRQRITIARALLNNPEILVLDEATSALDAESEKLVQKALEAVMANRTAIVIAHRLSTIQHADNIIVIQDGKILESGDHQSLLSKSGAYQKLVELQSF